LISNTGQQKKEVATLTQVATITGVNSAHKSINYITASQRQALRNAISIGEIAQQPINYYLLCEPLID